MKFNVKGVAMNRLKRCQIGEIRVEQIDTETNNLFKGLIAPLEIEQAYESFWNDLNLNSKEIVKVINVEQMENREKDEKEDL